MTTLKHTVGAPQLGIFRTVLDIFRFHQSTWLQFSIKMLNSTLKTGNADRKYEAVMSDDKWPSLRQKQGQEYLFVISVSCWEFKVIYAWYTAACVADTLLRLRIRLHGFLCRISLTFNVSDFCGQSAWLPLELEVRAFKCSICYVWFVGYM